jgi:hypothetical protein
VAHLTDRIRLHELAPFRRDDCHDEHGNYTNSIGAAVGIELFQGPALAQRERSSKTIVVPERELPVLAEN